MILSDLNDFKPFTEHCIDPKKKNSLLRMKEAGLAARQRLALRGFKKLDRTPLVNIQPLNIQKTALDKTSRVVVFIPHRVVPFIGKRYLYVGTTYKGFEWFWVSFESCHTCLVYNCLSKENWMGPLLLIMEFWSFSPCKSGFGLKGSHGEESVMSFASADDWPIVWLPVFLLIWWPLVTCLCRHLMHFSLLTESCQLRMTQLQAQMVRPSIVKRRRVTAAQ